MPIHEGLRGHHGYTGASSNSDNRDEAVSPSVRDGSAISVGGEAVPDRGGGGDFLPYSIANGSGNQMAADGTEADRGPSSVPSPLHIESKERAIDHGVPKDLAKKGSNKDIFRNRAGGGPDDGAPCQVVLEDSSPDSSGEKDGGLEVGISVKSHRERSVVPGEPGEPTAPSRDTAWQVSNNSTIQAVPIHEGLRGHHGYTGASSNSDNRDETVSPSVRDGSAISVGGEAVPDRAGCGGFLPNSIANGSGSQTAADGTEADRGPYVKEINKGGAQDGSTCTEDGDVHENQPGTNYTERDVQEDRDDVDDKIESDEIAPSTTDDTPERTMRKKRKMLSEDISGIGEIQPEIRKKEKCHEPEVKKSKFNDAVSVRAEEESGDGSAISVGEEAAGDISPNSDNGGEAVSPSAEEGPRDGSAISAGGEAVHASPETRQLFGNEEPSNPDNGSEAVPPSAEEETGEGSAISVGGEAVRDTAEGGDFLRDSLASGSGSEAAEDGTEAHRGRYVQEKKQGGNQDGSKCAEDSGVQEDRAHVDGKIENDEIAPSITDDTPESKKRKRKESGVISTKKPRLLSDTGKKEKCHGTEAEKKKFNDTVSVRAEEKSGDGSAISVGGGSRPCQS